MIAEIEVVSFLFKRVTQWLACEVICGAVILQSALPPSQPNQTPIWSSWRLVSSMQIYTPETHHTHTHSTRT